MNLLDPLGPVTKAGNELAETHSVPGIPDALKQAIDEVSSYELNEIFLIQYKDGSHIVERYFAFARKEGETAKEHLKRAINRAFQFCERCRYRFIHCQSFVIDLDEMEKRFAL